MALAFVPLVVALVGLVLYLVAGNGKVAEIGRVLFFCGALVVVMHLAGARTLHLP